MKTSAFLRTLGAAALFAPAAPAADCIDCDATTAVVVSGEYDAGQVSASITVTLAGTSFYGEPAYGAFTWDMIPGSAVLKPGKDYVAIVTGNDVTGYRLHFNTPNGYKVYINGLERSLWDASSTPLDWTNSDSFTVRVEVDAGHDFTPAGEALPLSNGRVVWRVGMGQLRNGRSAGHLALRQTALDSSAFQISSLIYETPSPEVDRVPAAGTLEQVRAPFGLATVAPISGGYEIRFYSQATGPDGSGRYTPSGSAFVTYEVTSQESGTVMRIERLRGVKRWRTELKKVSSTEWRMTDWHLVHDGQAPVTPAPVRYDVRKLSGGDLIEETLVKADAQGADAGAATRTLDTYANKNWRRELVQSKAAYDGTTGLTSTRTYHEVIDQQGRYGRLKSVTWPDGSWVEYDYHTGLLARGRLYREFRPWLDSPSTASSSPGSGHVTTYGYGPDWNGEYRLPVSTETRINNVLTTGTRAIPTTAASPTPCAGPMARSTPSSITTATSTPPPRPSWSPPAAAPGGS